MSLYSSSASKLTTPRAAAEPVERPPTRFRTERRQITAGQGGERRHRLAAGAIVPGTRYKLLRWLGEGGMGAVYEGLHIDTDRRVALKILHLHLCTRARAVLEFRREAKMSARIGDRGIVEMLDFEELDDGRLMCVMEFLDGRDLASLLSEAPIEPGRVIGILRQACKSLAAAHEAGVVHRDIKPENMMLVTDNGRTDRVKLLDFGIAAFLDEVRADEAAGGTPGYMAPEQILGYPSDHRVDMYALGCTAYELLTGQAVFAGSDVTELLRQHSTTPAPSFSSRTPGHAVPAALETVVLRCLAMRPEDRYADMIDLEAALCEAQLAAGLESAWDDLPLPDVDTARRERLLALLPDARPRWHESRPRWRRPATIIAGLGVMTLIVALVLGSTEAASDAARSRVDELTTQARVAASKAHFVYPPDESLQDETAYQAVLRLERLGEDGVVAAATQSRLLREEFAATLVRIGDGYWEEEHGRGFAIDYYTQAIIFAPDLEHARERALMTPGEIARISTAAASGSFTESELLAVEPLVALAEHHEDATTRRTALRTKTRAHAASSQVRLEELTRKRRVPARSTTADRDEPTNANAQPKASASTALAADDPLVRESTSSATKREDALQAAAKHAGRGRAELSAGRSGEAKRWFHRSLAANPRNISSLSGLGKIAFDEGSYDEAVKYRERIVAIASKSPKHRIALGDAYFKVMRYEQALEQYEKARELGSSSADARIAKINARLGQ